MGKDRQTHQRGKWGAIFTRYQKTERDPGGFIEVRECEAKYPAKGILASREECDNIGRDKNILIKMVEEESCRER